MLIKLTDDWWCDASLISAVRYLPTMKEKRIGVSFFDGGFAEVDGTPDDVARIVTETNAAKTEATRKEVTQK